MDYRNKLGTFTFDDNVQDSQMKLIVQNVTGQYFNPKKGEPELTDENSCYEFIRERCGNVLGGIGFELVIDDSVRIRESIVLTRQQELQQIIDAFDERVRVARDRQREVINTSFGGWLVGPAAVR